MHASVGGVRLSYELDGNPNGSCVVLSHSLGATSGIWEPQVRGLGDRFRLLRYDTRGHGGSSVPLGPYALADLVGDVIGLLDALRIERAHFVGISMGGMIGQLLALRHPDRLRGLVLSDTTSEVPPEARPMWQERIRVTERHGMEPHVQPTIERWFTEGFRRAHPDRVAEVAAMVQRTDPHGYVSCCHAIADLDLTGELHRVRAPTLVVVGAEDPGTTPDLARRIHEHIAGSEMAVLESASHLCNIEQAEAFNRVVGDFLERHDDRG